MNHAIGRWLKAGALMFVAVLVIAACEGTAGIPGEPGKPGQPGEAVGIPPQTQQISPITLVVAGKSASPIDLSDHFFDPDAGEGDSLTFTVSSDKEAVASGSVADGMLTVRASTMTGVAKLTITATDPQDLSSRILVTVTVMEAAAPNQAPTAVGTISEVKVMVGESETVDVASAFNDPDEGDTLTYEASVPDGENDASVTVEGSVVTITGKMVGSAAVTVTAMDTGKLSATQTINIDVIAVDRGAAPQSVGTPMKITLGAKGSQTVDVAEYFNHPDKDTLTYTAESNNAAVTPNITGSSLMVTANNETTSSIMAKVTVTATDSDGQTAQQPFEVTVGTMAPPKPKTYEVKIGAKTPLLVNALDYFVAMEGAAYSMDPDEGVVDVAPKSGSKTMFEIVALYKGSTVVIIEQISKDKATVNTAEITVTVPNQIPGRTKEIYSSDEFSHTKKTTKGVYVFEVDSFDDHFSDADDDALLYEGVYAGPHAKVLKIEDNEISVDIFSAKDNRVISVMVYAKDDGAPDVDDDGKRSLRSVRVRLALGEVAPQVINVKERSNGTPHDVRNVELRTGPGSEESYLEFGETEEDKGGIGFIRKALLVADVDLKGLQEDLDIVSEIKISTRGSSIKLLHCSDSDMDPEIDLVEDDTTNAHNNAYKLCFEPKAIGSTTITLTITVSHITKVEGDEKVEKEVVTDTFRVTVARPKAKKL